VLAAGDRMPQVEVTDDRGRRVSTSGWLGKPLVLWFYPKDDTPG
jgi:thioredoxin-dependent peroxiredoxin